MDNKQKTIFVYDDWSREFPVLMGRLYVQFSRGEEVFSFEYENSWLKNNNTLILDPDLSFYGGKQYVFGKKKQFGLFMDSEPDRWGRMLLKRRENVIAKREGRAAKSLTETDYLLGVEDFTRMGALRFKTEENGEFLAYNEDMTVPPVTRLRELEAASLAYEKDSELLNDKWVKLLIGPGSSLGGARPKANVEDLDGSLWIAKFPSRNDEYDSGAWEYVVHELAVRCGLNVPQAKIIKFSDFGSTFLVKRFDRAGTKRIHFASAMTLLGKSDGESNECSYLDLLEFLTSYGSRVKEDAIELWKRMVFNLAVKNTDDHLRNHGFILEKDGWRLSPLYDVNPNPDGTHLSLNITENDCSLDYGLALDTAKYYGITRAEAEKYVRETKTIISEEWQSIAKKVGLRESSLKYMQSAFVSETTI